MRHLVIQLKTSFGRKFTVLVKKLIIQTGSKNFDLHNLEASYLCTANLEKKNQVYNQILSKKKF